MRTAVVATAVCLSLFGIAYGGNASAAIRKAVTIAPQPLSTALKQLANDRGVQVLYLSDTVRSLQTRGAAGDLTTDEAFRRLLEGTGLTHEFIDDNTVSVFPERRSTGAGVQDRSSSGNDGTDSQDADGRNPSVWGRLRLSQAEQGAAPAVGVPASPAENRAEGLMLQEVIVTAQKREERQQDVPIAMTVLDPQALSVNGQNRLADYFASVPGLNLSGAAFYGGTTYLTIRGLSAGNYANSTVSTVIDDVPIGSGNLLAEGMLATPDIDPSDLARVEVLKGPQGTLYGADSLSGLVKYVTIDPSTSAFSGRVEVGGSTIPGGGQGYVVRGAANIPLSATLAVRVSAFSRHDPGYIDNIISGEKSFNTADVVGTHLAALWRPAEDFSVKLGALIQRTHGNSGLINYDGYGTFTSGDLKYSSLPGSVGYSTEQQLYTSNLDWKVAGFDVVSVTGFSVNELDNLKDGTGWAGVYGCNSDPKLFPAVCRVVPGYPATGIIGMTSEADFVTRKLTQEVRISATIGKWLDWRLAGFYTHENTPHACQSHNAADPSSGELAGNLYQFCGTTLNSSEYAIFGDLTAHITDRFDIELGGRESWYTQNYQLTSTGPATEVFDGAASPFVGPLQHITGDAFTYQVTPRFKLSQDLMLYARVASGYRIGGPNADAFIIANSGLQIPKAYDPDRTTNYELGIKADVLEHTLSFDAAAYYISWKNFQINVNPDQFNTYTANAGDAKSAGVELSVEAHPLPGLNIAAVGSYDDAVLTQDLPSTSSAYGLKGDELPYSMKYSAGLTINQDIRLSQNVLALVGAAANYVGTRPYEFSNPNPGAAPTPRQYFPSYTQVNLRSGLHYGSWLANLYVNNVADKRGIIGIIQSTSIIAPGGWNASVIQPRTFGLDISLTF